MVTVSKQYTAPTGGAVTVDVMVPKDDGYVSVANSTSVTGVINPLPVKFYANLTAATFEATDTYDPITDTTFTGDYKPKDHRIEYYWNFGDTGHWSKVSSIVPAEYSDKASGRGRVGFHVYTEPGTYNWTLLVWEPDTGKISTASGTIVVDNYLESADTIVLINHNDTDYSAFDSTGLTATIVQHNLGNTQMTASVTAYTANRAGDNVVWLFKGEGTNSDIYDMDWQIDSDDIGDNHVIGSYGSGRFRVDKDAQEAIELIGGGANLQPKPIRLRDMFIQGDFDNVNDEVLDAPSDNGYPLQMASGGWWMINYNVKCDDWGTGGGVWIASSGTNSWLTCASCDVADPGSEYMTLMSSGATSEYHGVGNYFHDAPGRWANDGSDVKNSMIRCSGPNMVLLSKNRIFMMRRGSGQGTIKIGHGAGTMEFSHVYFNVLEASSFIMGIYPVANTNFNEVNVVVEFNIGIGTPWTQQFCQAQAEGASVRYNLLWQPAWPVDVSNGDNTIRCRYFFTCNYEGLQPSTDYVGAINEVYGNTIISDQTSVQNGATAKSFGPIILVDKDIGSDPDWTGISVDTNSCRTTYEGENLIHTPNMDTVYNAAAPLDDSSTSTTGPKASDDSLISPIFSGWRALQGPSTVDTDFDLSGRTLPSGKLGAASAYAGAKNILRRHTCDYLGNRRGPKWSQGAAEVDTDANIVPVKTA